MRRTVALLLAMSMLALPAFATAQSAGDEQYADPFGETEQPDGSQEQPASEPQAAPAPAEPPVVEQQVVASQQADAPTLPATGLPALLLAGAGTLMFAGGAALHRRVS